MNLRRRSKAQSEVSTHSLNDIMFFLLLFFLIASTMANPAVIKVLLPKAKETTPVVNVHQVNLIVTKDLQYYIGKDKTEVPKSAIKDALMKYTGTNEEVTFV